MNLSNISLLQKMSTCVLDRYIFVMVVIASSFLLQIASEEAYQNVLSISSSDHISNLADNLQNSTEVRFIGKNFNLNELVRVTGKSKIKFTGNASLYCSIEGGFLFENVKNLTIHRIALQNCGIEDDHSTGFSFTASLFVLNCNHVNITMVNISGTSGNDLVIENSIGEVNVVDSSFAGNNGRSTQHSLTGVHLVFEYDGRSLNKGSSDVTFTGCIFGPLKVLAESGCQNSKERKNGSAALNILLGENTVSHEIKINSCNFINHHSSGKGAMHMLIKNNASKNVIKINNCVFEGNLCPHSGGGGARVDMIKESDFVPSRNNMTFFNCTFIKNCARFGGGVLINSSKACNKRIDKNTVNFIKCAWKNNSAYFGSAFDAVISPGDKFTGNWLLTPHFINCNFTDNSIEELRNENVVIYGKGTLSANYFHIKFEEINIFKSNIGSALYLSSASAEFTENSTAIFDSNKGLDGGAISMLGHSSIGAQSGSKFNFTGNIAYFKGGAIYYNSNDGHDYLTDHQCFIQYIFNNTTKSAKIKPLYTFNNNRAGYEYTEGNILGRSIYANSLIPCNRQCGSYGPNFTASINTTFSCIGTFRFSNESREFEVATGEWMIKLSPAFTEPYPIIPGKEDKLPVRTTDELDQTLDSVYMVILWKGNTPTDKKAEVAHQYRYIHKNKIVLHGKPSNITHRLSLTTEHNRKIRLSIDVTLAPCPPGYTLYESVCRCSAELGTQHRYPGINTCNWTDFQAKLQIGYWVGYGNDSYTSLISSVCPRRYCSLFLHKECQKKYLLPNTYDPAELNHLICGESREGMLCARCQENLSVHFHSNTYRCKSNDLCSIGWLFYSLSELLPVTGIFLTVIAFDLQLTSGPINGLILYYQLLDNMVITAHDFVKYPNKTYLFYKSHQFYTHMFNFDFFSTYNLSFCLWKGATSLDMIAFKYVTVAYSLLMVLLTILVMKTFSLKCICLKLRRAKSQKREVTNSVIHGLSGFFILTYSQCTIVSLKLLQPIQYTDPYNSLKGQWYILYNGEMKYFERQHLKYAFPALFFIFTIVIIPPVILIAYPLCYRILALVKLEESKFSTILCKVIPLERIRPFFDSFQGSFKDKHRYMSGLYFIYRFISVFLSVYTIHHNLLFYILLEIQLLLMIFIHAYFQPYKNGRHNRQDLAIFVNLAVINVLTIFNVKKSMDILDQQRVVNIATTIQTVLIYLPTLYIVIKVGYHMVLIIKRCCTKEKNISSENDTELVEREDEEHFSGKYSLFENSNSSVVS